MIFLIQTLKNDRGKVVEEILHILKNQRELLLVFWSIENVISANDRGWPRPRPGAAPRPMSVITPP